MDVNVNINNKNKHWILAILEKIKDILIYIWRFVINAFKSIGRFIKNKWKILVGIIFLCLIALIIGLIVDYYRYEYLPQKRLDDAVANIHSKLNAKSDTAKANYAYEILTSDFASYSKNESFSNTTWTTHSELNLDNSNRVKVLREAFEYIEAQADAKNPRCQFLLGQLYARQPELLQTTSFGGIYKFYHVKTDSVKAAYWWNEAALQGYVKAYNNIGIAYYIGFGVKIDKKKAVEWLKKGAEAGDATAEFSYGCLFRNGCKEKSGTHKEMRSTSEYVYSDDYVIRRVWDSSKDAYITYYWEVVEDSVIIIPKDIEQAKYWWKKAAAQGNEKAKDCLQRIYN